MLNNQYDVLGISSNATDAEVFEAYDNLRKRYSEDRFLEGEAGNEAARKLTEVETAYAEIMDDRRQNYTAKSDNQLYIKIENAIKSGDLQEAQNLLDGFDQRGSEWHYLQSVVFYKKNWVNESKKQLEIAVSLDGSNDKYKTALDKLNKLINDSGSAKTKNQNAYTSQNVDGDEAPQMGGNGCMQWCCEMAICNICMNCLCNCR